MTTLLSLEQIHENMLLANESALVSLDTFISHDDKAMDKLQAYLREKPSALDTFISYLSFMKAKELQQSNKTYFENLFNKLKSATKQNDSSNNNDLKYLLALCYCIGLGTSANETQVKQLIAKLARDNYAKAYSMLAFYAKRDSNDDLAEKYYKKAINLGDRISYSLLAGLYLYNEDLNPSVVKAYDTLVAIFTDNLVTSSLAIHYYEKAAPYSVSACTQLASIYASLKDEKNTGKYFAAIFNNERYRLSAADIARCMETVIVKFTNTYINMQGKNTLLEVISCLPEKAMQYVVTLSLQENVLKPEEIFKFAYENNRHNLLKNLHHAKPDEYYEISSGLIRKLTQQPKEIDHSLLTINMPVLIQKIIIQIDALKTSLTQPQTEANFENARQLVDICVDTVETIPSLKSAYLIQLNKLDIELKNLQPSNHAKFIRPQHNGIIQPSQSLVTTTTNPHSDGVELTHIAANTKS